MKKFIAIITSIILAASACACGASGTPAQKESAQEQETVTEAPAVATTEAVTEAATEATTQDPEEAAMQEDMEELSAVGDVEVKEGLLTVAVTIPASFAEGVTQEDLDAKAGGETYQSAKLNEDGSVTYKMTKKQHRAMLQQIVSAVEESSQEMIADTENYSITDVKHNDDLTQFDVTLSGTELGFGDSFSVIAFYMYGGIYGIFSGKQPEHVIVNFYDPEGNLIESGDSAQMGE